jgi:3-oxoadipate enol-lactonase
MPHSTQNNVTVHYEVAGEGMPFVMLHANPFDHNLWMYQIAHFSTWFKVIAIDIRGWGRSDKVTGEYTLGELCADVLGVMENERVDRAILMGCSVGAGMAILLGLDHPRLFEALILVGGRSGAGSRFEKRIEGYTKGALGAYHRGHIKELVAPGFAESPLGRHLLGTFTERHPRLVPEAIAQVFRARNRADTTPRLGTMEVPTLVINGEFPGWCRARCTRCCPAPAMPVASRTPPDSTRW